MSPIDGKMICTEHFVKAMRKEGMRHEDLAEAIGVSLSTISRIRHRQVAVSSDRLTLIARALNVTEEYLLNPPIWVVTPSKKVICSMCQCEMPMIRVQTENGTKARNWASMYCPQCGNRMRNGKSKEKIK